MNNPFEVRRKYTPNERRNGAAGVEATWRQLEEDVEKFLNVGNWRSIAHILACSFDGEDPIDAKEREDLFTDPAFKGHHQELWNLIIEDNATAGIPWSYHDEAYALVTEKYGWELSDIDSEENKLNREKYKQYQNGPS